MFWKVQVEQDFEFYVKESEIYSSGNFSPLKVLGIGTPVFCVLSCSSHVWLFVTPSTVARQAPLSIKFSRQEYWSGLPCPPPRHLSNPGIEPTSLISPVLAGSFFTSITTWSSVLRGSLNPPFTSGSLSTILPCASLLFHGPTKPAPTSGSLNLLFLLSGHLFSQVFTRPPSYSVLSFISLCKCHLVNHTSLFESNRENHLTQIPNFPHSDSQLSSLLHFFSRTCHRGAHIIWHLPPPLNKRARVFVLPPALFTV